MCRYQQLRASTRAWAWAGSREQADAYCPNCSVVRAPRCCDVQSMILFENTSTMTLPYTASRPQSVVRPRSGREAGQPLTQRPRHLDQHNRSGLQNCLQLVLQQLAIARSSRRGMLTGRLLAAATVLRR